MYQILLFLHSWGRWLVLGAGVLTVYRAYVGWTGRRPFTKADNATSAAFSGFLWLQVIVGLGLYFGLSPLGLTYLKAHGMKDPVARFYGVEHIAVMLFATILAQVGRIAVKRAPEMFKHRKALLYFGVALVLVLLMIPWGIWNPQGHLGRGL